MSTNFADLEIRNQIGATKRSMALRFAEIVNAKDYGVKGDGSTNDGPAIQSLFDNIFGSQSNPHASNNAYLNKGIFFPRGLYNVGQQLFLNHVWSGFIVGEGQKNTVFRYTGTATDLDGDGLTSMLVCRTVSLSVFEGFTLDAQNICDQTLRLKNLPGVWSDGTGNSWRDICCTNAIYSNFLSGWQGAGALGSEQLFKHCKFKNCGSWGFRIVGANALDYELIHCTFDTCVTGISCIVGGINAIRYCNFINNTNIDIHQKQQNALHVIGCHSNSPNFVAAGPCTVKSCTHDCASAGNFYQGNIAAGLDNKRIIIEGCYSKNGTIVNSGTTRVYLKANQFDNSSYLSSYTGYLWIDDTPS